MNHPTLRRILAIDAFRGLTFECRVGRGSGEREYIYHASSDGELAAPGDDGAREAQDGLIRAIGVLPAGDLQAPLLAPTMQQKDDEETGNQAGESSELTVRFPSKVSLAIVGLLALGVGTAFIVLWFASYNFDLEELIQQEIEGYQVGDSLFDVAILLLFLCTSLVVASSLG